MRKKVDRIPLLYRYKKRGKKFIFNIQKILNVIQIVANKNESVIENEQFRRMAVPTNLID